MSDVNDEINKKKNNEQDWSKVERTKDLADYVYAKYGNSWKESDEVTDEMLDDLYNYAMLKVLMVVPNTPNGLHLICYVKKYLSMNFKDEIADVILEDLWMKYGKDDKGKEKEAEHDQLKVNKVMHFVVLGQDDKGKRKVHHLKNIVEKLEVDFAKVSHPD
ncbi:hypothetical protein Tco_1568492 [Tanacetum coccineum]